VPKNEDAAALPLIVRLSPLPSSRTSTSTHRSRSRRSTRESRPSDQPGQHRRPDKVEQVVRAAKTGRHPDAHRRELRLAAEAPASRSRSRIRPEALVAAALEEVELLEKLEYRDFKISVQGDACADDDPRVPDARSRGARTRFTSA
jgi:hypothetical protein